MIEHDALIAEYSHEKSRPREAEALRALQKVASMVKPIMRQRGWKVGVLTEFYPPERNLLGLNWNRGQKICLRLRYPIDERQFLPLEDVVDTMLHELCHIVHGPHHDAFHNLWNQLRDEHEALLRKGYTGEGFLSTGHKLGGARRIPMHEARRRARAAAEQRRVLAAGSGQKLGGRAVGRGQDIRRVIADAAQRRANISKGCAAVHDDVGRTGQLVDEAARNGFRTKAEEDGANERAIMQAYMELVQEEERERYGQQYVPPSQENPAGSQGLGEAGSSSQAPPVPTRTKPLPPPAQAKPPPAPSSSRALEARRESSKPATAPADPESLDPEPPLDFWSCPICTLNNALEHLACDACGGERPAGATPRPTSTHPPSRPASTNPPTSIDPSSRPPSANPPLRSTAAERASDAAAARARKQSGLRNLAQLYGTEESKPLGWLCARCGNFMEQEWWTCAQCGAMKEAS